MKSLLTGRCRGRFAATAGSCCLLSVFLLTAPVAADKTAPKKRLALLVGCTKYRAADALDGPKNDVELVHRLLRSRFGFEEGEIRRLVGWPDNPPDRPTYGNIVREFERLIAQAGPRTQIVILLSGHGSQMPVPRSQRSLLDPRNPEPDGMDEVFLPSDVGQWAKGTVPHCIRDNQVDAWLSRMEKKGADVWLICDCCHSGTLSKSGQAPVPGLRWRQVDPQEGLGIPAGIIEESRRRAEKEGGGNSLRDTNPMDVHPQKGSGGSVVAFYAAQPFERAPELPRPAGAELKPENAHGMLTYSLVQALLQNSRPVTYEELSQRILLSYRSDELSFALPTPFCSGSIDREVLGLHQWPQRSALVLERHDNKLFVTGGELKGLQTGSILRVHPPAGRKQSGKRLGYVKIIKSGVLLSEVFPVEYREKQGTVPAVRAEQFPELARCEVVYRAVGWVPLTLALQAPSPQQMQQLRRLLVSSSKKGGSRTAWFRVVPAERAEFLLQMNPRHQAELRRTGHTKGQKPLQVYSLSADDSAAQRLQEDLRRIFLWKNLWRVSAAAQAGSAAQSPSFHFSVESGDKEKKQGPKGTAVHFPQEILRLHLDNSLGVENVWVTILFLDARFGITELFSTSMKAGAKLEPLELQITGDSYGREGLVVLVQNLKAFGQKPRFDYLVQPSVGAPSGGGKGTGPGPQPTPFQQLLADSVAGKNAKGFPPGHPANPVVFTYSWITRPSR